MKANSESSDEEEEIQNDLVEFAPTPIECHSFRDGQVYYGISDTGTLKFYKEDNINRQFIYNYWNNLEIIKSKNQLPAEDGEIVSLLKDQTTNLNLQFIVKTNDKEIPYKILNKDLSLIFLGARAIDFLEQNYKTL